VEALLARRRFGREDAVCTMTACTAGAVEPMTDHSV
jgi:hypothetical protein